ncbi:unnamed protein product [Amaranthus hypochondriacus]
MDPDGNPNPQERLEMVEQGLVQLKDELATQIRDEVASLEARFTQKQDRTDRSLAILMEGQPKVLDRLGQKDDKPEKDRNCRYRIESSGDWRSRREWEGRRPQNDGNLQGGETN